MAVATPFHAGDVTSAIQTAQQRGLPLLVALHDEELEAVTLSTRRGATPRAPYTQSW